MKRLVLFGFLGAMASVLAGCPIFDDADRGERPTCGERLGCDQPPLGCSAASECGINETCGQDNQCHTGDCGFWGCPAGQSCVLGKGNTLSCEPNAGTSSGGSTGGDGGGGPGGGGAGGAGGVVYCGNPGDCGEAETCAPDGTCHAGSCTEEGCIYGYACDAQANPPACKPQNPAACGADTDCAAAGLGYACVSGVCTAPGDQCFDQTQCPAGDVCAAGKCTPACVKSADCPTSYACDTSVGICTTPAKPCTITNDCGGADQVCVDGACVPRSAGGSCPPGLVWVQNGCIPSQSASFICNADGQQGACAAGSVCLHHSCYISCEPPNQSACTNLPSFNQCKPVTTTSGSHQVCGSSANLGGDCDPTAALACGAGKICIDGFCK